MLIVSILVLMEVPLKSIFNLYSGLSLNCFNPCFDGSAAEMRELWNSNTNIHSFNPCFDGSAAEIIM